MNVVDATARNRSIGAAGIVAMGIACRFGVGGHAEGHAAEALRAVLDPEEGVPRAEVGASGDGVIPRAPVHGAVEHSIFVIVLVAAEVVPFVEGLHGWHGDGRVVGAWRRLVGLGADDVDEMEEG